MRQNELITYMLPNLLNDNSITGKFIDGIIYKKRYLRTTTKTIIVSSTYNLYFVPIPSGVSKITVNHLAVVSNLYGMGFTKYASDTTDTISLIECWDRKENPRILTIPSNAKYFVISAKANEIEDFSYTFHN